MHSSEKKSTLLCEGQPFGLRNARLGEMIQSSYLKILFPHSKDFYFYPPVIPLSRTNPGPFQCSSKALISAEPVFSL